MQPLELSTSTPISLASASVTAASRASQILSRSSSLGALDFFGGPGLQSVVLRLPELEAVGDKETAFADTVDSNGNILKIAITFEKIDDNVIRATAGRPGTLSGFRSTFDIYLGDGGNIHGFDTNLDGRIDAITPPTITVPSNVFGGQPLTLQLSILSFGGGGGVVKEEPAPSILSPSLSLNTLLIAQSSTDTSSTSTTGTTDTTTTDTTTTDTGTTDPVTNANGPSDFALGQGNKNGI